MGTLALHAERQVAAPPDLVFALFGEGAGRGWLFDAACDDVRVGAVVTLRVPLGGPAVEPVDILGRIGRVRAPERIDIVHEQPWRGRLQLLFDAIATGTRLRLIAELDDVGLEWLLRRRGYATFDPVSPHEHAIGLLTSKSGPGSVFAAAAENAATLAVEEINAEGGLRGRPVRLVVGDDATDPEVGVAEARRLVAAGCRAIMLTTTSATFARTADTLRDTGVLLVHTLMNEGGLGGETVFQLGERPGDQLHAAVGPMMRTWGGRRWFLAGDDYNWPRLTASAARRVIAEEDGTVVGEGFAPLGTREFGPLIEAILTSGADLILSTFVGADSVAFERQCLTLGIRERCRTLAPAMDESTLERIGPEAATGITAVSGYFQHLPTDANEALLARYRRAFGPWAPPLSSLTESAYEALLLNAAAVRRALDGDARAVARELRCGRLDLPRGTVTLHGARRHAAAPLPGRGRHRRPARRRLTACLTRHRQQHPR